MEDRFPGVPERVSFWTRWRAASERRRARERRLKLLKEARRTLQLLIDSEHASDWEIAVASAEADVRARWAEYYALEDLRDVKVRQKSLQRANEGVPKPPSPPPQIPPGVLMSKEGGK